MLRFIDYITTKRVEFDKFHDEGRPLVKQGIRTL